MKAPWCSECTIDEGEGASRGLRPRHRLARALVGVISIAVAAALVSIPLPYVAWPLAAIAAWFGLSHVVAAGTGYPDCPELGAIASLLLRRYVSTRCGPWERLDRLLDRATS
jgi:hypothetical protein